MSRWYHSSLTGREAETLLLSRGQDGSYLVRTSVHNPGYFVLSARVDERVFNVVIRKKDGVFDVGGGPQFSSINELVEHYKKNPMVEKSEAVIHLKHPFHATSFLPANIFQRVQELQKRNQEVYGKTGFWEEFEVSYLYVSSCDVVIHISFSLQQLQQQDCKLLYTRKEGARPENMSKNRYKNILPCKLSSDM